MALLLRVVSGGYCPAFGRARQRSQQNEVSSTFLVVQHSGLGVVLGHVARVLAAAIVSVPALAGKVVVAYLVELLPRRPVVLAGLARAPLLFLLLAAALLAVRRWGARGARGALGLLPAALVIKPGVVRPVGEAAAIAELAAPGLLKVKALAGGGGRDRVTRGVLVFALVAVAAAARVAERSADFGHLISRQPQNQEKKGSRL
mmetsp:Transcript_21901/g.49514  ORF Transcript_21901/g.49514 Transcript_21901/m.49514 type:complete len:203 (-) Transcript_21901:134-742(-)